MSKSGFTKKWINLAEEFSKKVVYATNRIFIRVTDGSPISHIRLNIHPDGGISRLRVYRRPADI